MTIAAVQYLAEIPSPTQGVWHLGPVPIRAYALCILFGIIAACAITEVRLRHRGAPKWLVLDVAVWAVPFGIVGARIYHLITSPDDYFGAGGEPLKALRIWEGGLGIWGGVAGGAVGAWIALRRMGLPLTFFADALAPGLPVAQAIGRLGNWFNNELYGRHTDLPWGLKIYDYDLDSGKANVDPVTGEAMVLDGGPFHPTFLYESVWDLGVAVLVWLVDRKYKLGKGRAFALYIMAYCLGRFFVEAMRDDKAHIIAGMRVNNWVALLLFLGALIYFVRVRGPQEHIRVLDDGRMQLVTAEGEPIAWRGARADDASGPADESDDGPPPTASSAVAPSTDASPAADPPGDTDGPPGGTVPEAAPDVISSSKKTKK